MVGIATGSLHPEIKFIYSAWPPATGSGINFGPRVRLCSGREKRASIDSDDGSSFILDGGRTKDSKKSPIWIRDV